MSTDMKERTDLARLTGAVDTLAGVKAELAALEAASRAAEGPEEVEGINHIARRLYWEMVDTVEIVAGVQEHLRERKADSLTLDEEGVRDLIADLYRLGAAAAKGDDMGWTERQLRNAMKAVSLKVDRIVAGIERSAGLEISGAERDAIFGAVSSWGDKALSLGADAVEEVGS